MKPIVAWLVVIVLAATVAAALAAPIVVAAALVALGLALARRPRTGLFWFAVTSLVINALLLAYARPEGRVVHVAHVAFGSTGALDGLRAGTRLVAVVAFNLGLMQRLGTERLLEGLRLPRRATGHIAAVLLAARDIQDDARRLVLARRADGSWPSSRWRRALAAGPLVPALVAASMRRAAARRDALQLAGIRTGARFAPLVAVTALAVAGRMPFVALPNVALTYVVVFAGGMVFGARVGLLAGMAAMALTNLFLSGLLPAPYANVPAMGLVGLAGAACRRLGDGDGSAADRWATRLLAAGIGVAATLVFSVAADAATWAMVPDYHHDPVALRTLVAAGLAFNVVPALLNGVVFAAAIAPLARGMAFLKGSSPRAAPAS